MDPLTLILVLAAIFAIGSAAVGTGKGWLGRGGGEASGANRSAPVEGAPVPLRWRDRFRRGSRSGGAPVAPAPGAPGARPRRFRWWPFGGDRSGAETWTRDPDRSGPPDVEPSPLPDPPERPDRSAPDPGTERPSRPTEPAPEAPGPERESAPDSGGHAPPGGEPGLPLPIPNQPGPTNPEPYRTRSWRDDRPGPQVTTDPERTALNPAAGGRMSGELSTTAEGGLAVPGAGRTIEVGRLTIADIRDHYTGVAEQSAQMYLRLEGLGDFGTLVVAEYRQAAELNRIAAAEFGRVAEAMAAEGLDQTVIAKAIRQREAALAMAATADRIADETEAAIRNGRAQLREQAMIVGQSAASLVEDINVGYGPTEQAVQSSPLQMPTYTRVFAQR